MHVRWGAWTAATMRVCWLTTVLAALAMRSSAEPTPRRFSAEWRNSHDLQIRSRPLHEIFEPDSASIDQDQSYVPHQQSTVHKDRRRMRNNKRTPHLPAELASQMMLRASRSGRPYDVPQIECPPAADGMERFACPTPDRQGRYRCIDDHVLCDGFIDCPNGEDEDRQAYEGPSRRSSRRASAVGARSLSEASLPSPKARCRYVTTALPGQTDVQLIGHMKLFTVKAAYP